MSILAHKIRSEDGGVGRQSGLARRPTKGTAPRWWVLLVLLALLGLMCEPVLAQDAVEPEEPTPEDPADGTDDPAEVDDAPATGSQQSGFLANGRPRITIESISPAHGPVTGDTRVTVRGGPFDSYAASYPEPKCRFGSDQMIVAGAYVACPQKARKVYEREAKRTERTHTCVQCENSPASLESKPVEFTVSLTGDFSDVSSAA